MVNLICIASLSRSYTFSDEKAEANAGSLSSQAGIRTRRAAIIVAATVHCGGARKGKKFTREHEFLLSPGDPYLRKLAN